MIYFVYKSYVPNTAVMNRALSYIRSIEKIQIPITVVFFLPDFGRSVIPDKFEYITINYFWKKYYINHPILKYISYFIYLYSFRKQLRKGDKVYIYGNDDILKRLVNIKGVSFYFEKTECPEVNLTGNRFHTPTIEEHLDLCKKVDGLIVISNQLKEYYCQHGIDSKKIHVVNMTVDPNRFNTLHKQINQEQYIAYCGTVSNNKDGVNILLESFSYVLKEKPDIKLYIIGDTPSKEDASGNLQLIRDLGIENNVKLTGRITAEQMPQLLKNAQILALARPDNKQAKYGFPTKLGEYLLTGNPVAITAVGDIPLFMKDRINAIVVPPNDSQAFTNGLIWLLNHPKESAIIGEKGRNTALSHFNSEKETKKLLDVINAN